MFSGFRWHERLQVAFIIVSYGLVMPVVLLLNVNSWPEWPALAAWPLLVLWCYWGISKEEKGNE